MDLYEKFGGIGSFGRTKLSSEWKYLRGQFVMQHNFPDEKFKEIVLLVPELSRVELYSFTSHPSVYSDEELFQKFWKLNREKTFSGLTGFETHTRVGDVEFGNFYEDLPIIHSNDCLNGHVANHYWCETPAYYPGRSLPGFR